MRKNKAQAEIDNTKFFLYIEMLLHIFFFFDKNIRLIHHVFCNAQKQATLLTFQRCLDFKKKDQRLLKLIAYSSREVYSRYTCFLELVLIIN
ncbi:hypothetical protein, partial [Bartonella henselae]